MTTNNPGAGAPAPILRNKLNRHPEVAAPLRGPRRMAAHAAHPSRLAAKGGEHLRMTAVKVDAL
jgi:hypothetical protein